MKLQKMTDFVLEQSKKINDPEILARTLVQYALFLEKPLTLGMFVPCDKNDIPIEIDTEHKEQPNSWSLDEIEQYQEAKQRVLFDGIEYLESNTKESYSIIRICKSLSPINYPKFWHGITIENLIPYDLILTESGKQQSGL